MEPRYDNGMWESSDGMVAVQRDGLWGFADQTGREVITCQYQAKGVPYLFNESRACVCFEDRWVIVDPTGRFVFKRSLDAPSSGVPYKYSGNRAAVRYEGIGRWLGLSGQFVGGPAFGQTRGFAEGLAAATSASDPRLWGYVDDDASWMIQPRFHVAGSFQNGRAAVARNRRWGFADRHGDLVVPQAYDGVFPFREDRAFVRRGRAWAIIDGQGTIVGKHRFLAPFDSPDQQFALAMADAESFSAVTVHPLDGDSGAGPGVPRYRYGFSEGLAAVRTPQGWGYVDDSGDFVIEPRFAVAGSFSGGVAVVAEGSGAWPPEWYVITPTGEAVDDVAWGGARRLVDGVVRVQDGKRHLYIDAEGRQVWPQKTGGLLGRIKALLRR